MYLSILAVVHSLSRSSRASVAILLVLFPRSAQARDLCPEVTELAGAVDIERRAGRVVHFAGK